MAIKYTVDTSGNLLVTNTAIPSGNTITNSTTETDFQEPQPVLGPEMWFPGRVFELYVSGSFSTALIVPSVIGKVKLNSVTIGTTGSILNVASISNKYWYGVIKITVLTTGTTGTIEVSGVMYMQTGLTMTAMPMQNIGTITIDTTVPQTMKMSAQWNLLSTSNSITLRQFILKG